MKTLFACMALCFFVLAILGNRVISAQKQRRVVDAIHRLGGDVLYDYEYDFTPENGRPKGWRRPATPPFWLQMLFGKDFVADVVYVQFNNPRLSDKDLVCLLSLKKLRHVNLVGTNVTDRGVERLKRAFPNSSVTKGELGS